MKEKDRMVSQSDKRDRNYVVIRACFREEVNKRRFLNTQLSGHLLQKLGRK